MKKVLSFTLAIAMLVGLFAGCSSTTTSTTTTEADTVDMSSTTRIVTTIFPIYDWTRNIIGDAENIELSLLVDDGVDLHSFQPTVDDIVTISSCDVFIYVGGESDAWVEAVLSEAVNENMVAINLLEVLGDSVKFEETVEGMQETEHDHDHSDEETEDHDHEEAEVVEEEHDHDHEEAEVVEEEHDHEEAEAVEEEHDHDHEEAEVVEEEHDHEEEAEEDEHVWLSLKNAQVICSYIAEALSDATGADFSDNTTAYQAQLADLDEQYAEVVETAACNVLLFGDRFPFRYLVDDYNIEYYAAFSGCSAETEASFETIAFLAQKVDELELHTVLNIDGTEHKIAETVISSTASADQQILVLDSMQSTTMDDVLGGTTYISVMESNLTVLSDALN